MKTSTKNLLCLALALGAAPTVFSQTALVVGSFDFARSGHVSISSGDYFQQFRTVLTNGFSNVTFTGFTTLTTSNLAGLDVLVLAPGTSHNTGSTPLSTNEQAAVLDYVRQGGGAVILADNYSYAPNATEEETALLAPFGMTGCCTINGTVTVTVPAPALHPVTSGIFGTTAAFSQLFPGGLTSLGTNAIALATNSLGVALAVINPNALAPGSGRVVIFSDGNTFADEADVGSITADQVLLLNTVAWSRRSPRLTIERSGLNVVLRWPTSAPGYHLQAAALLGAVTVWTNLTSPVTIIGSENVVTNGVAGAAKFYRLAYP